MVPTLVDFFRDWLVAHGLYGYVRVFTYTEFRAILAALMSFAIVLAAGPRVIAKLVSLKIKDNPNFYNKTLDEITKSKSGTPTMGGILIAGSIFLTTITLADMRPTQGFYVYMAILVLVWLGLVGFWDDRYKLLAALKKTGSRDGLYSWEKLVLQFGLAVVIGIFLHHYGTNKEILDVNHLNEMSHCLNLPFVKTWEKVGGDWVPSQNLIVLGTFSFTVLTVIVITATSNAVNLTDGMDGLASGVTCIVILAVGLLALLAGWEDGQAAKHLLIPYIRYSDELAVVAGAMFGACLGFLWFNCNPASVFMGDTGSLPLGGLIGYIAVVIRQEFLLMIIGGVFVMEAMSVMIQVGYFKWTKGKRVFKMAPIHHHFNLIGWSEQKVVVRFWIITVILAALALAMVKLR